jgi:hypothetical protein
MRYHSMSQKVHYDGDVPIGGLVYQPKLDKVPELGRVPAVVDDMTDTQITKLRRVLLQELHPTKENITCDFHQTRDYSFLRVD